MARSIHISTARTMLNSGDPVDISVWLSACRFRSIAEKEHLLEHRTDGTDAFDTLYIGAEKFPYHDSFLLRMTGVI